jgi:predicted RNA methylase
MLADEVRLQAYKGAIYEISRDKVVVDVGAGTGVLSVFAAEAGASKVYAIEKADIYKRCKKEVNKKGLEKTIKVMNCLAEEAPLEKATADVIISEWMGFFLLFERMLPSVLAVRNMTLKEGGTMIPGKAKLLIAAATIQD